MQGYRHGEFSWRLFFQGAARRLGIRTTFRPDIAAEEAVVDPWTRPTGSEPDTALSALLTQIEAEALAVYEADGLPIRPGHYARAPNGSEWQFVAEALTPEERWALVQDYPPEDGWRFATLPSLGLHQSPGSPSIAAADLLQACQMLRHSPEARHEAVMPLLERSIRLGAAWASVTRRLEPAPVELAKPKRIARAKKVE